MPAQAMMSTANSEYARTNFGVGAKWVKNLSKDRLGTFLDGRYGDVNLGSVLFTERIDDAEHVKLKGWSAPGRTKPSFQEAMKQHFVDISKGYAFGPSCTCSIRGASYLHRLTFPLSRLRGIAIIAA